MSKLKLPIIHMNVFDITYLLKALKAKKFRVIPLSVFYPPIRVLSPHPCFIPPSVFYPLIRVLSPHPCFIPSSVSSMYWVLGTGSDVTNYLITGSDVITLISCRFTACFPTGSDVNKPEVTS